MQVKAIEFGGNCTSCPNSNNDIPTRGGVEVMVDRYDDDDGVGEMMCLRCAGRLARMLVAAIAKTKEKRAKGFIYRHDEWKKGKRSNSNVTSLVQEDPLQ